MIKMDIRQSEQANDSTGIVKCAKEEGFALQNAKKSAARGQIGTLQLSKEFESVNKLFLSA